MSAPCPACGFDNVERVATCRACGVGLRGSTTHITPLPHLQPEAEPPLPAAHEALRVRTPPLGEQRRDPTPPRRDPTPLRVVAEISEPPATTAAGPLEDPSAWFRDNTPDRGQSMPLTSESASPAVHSGTDGDPRRVPPPFGEEIPALTGAAGFWRRAIVAVVLCILVGALVGWVLSAGDAPTH